jgi:uncharacterized protein (DUF1330 family)
LFVSAFFKSAPNRAAACDADCTSLPGVPTIRTDHNNREVEMAKGYWVSTYFSVSDPNKLAEYAKLAGPAIAAAGGRFLARGNAAKAYEKGLKERVVIIEFDSVEKAAAAHDGPGYQAALKALGDGAQRDIRIVEALS